jgi:ribosomal protein L11 methyltransferase
VGSGVLAIAGAKLGWDPVAGFDHEQAAVDAAGANAAANHVNVALARINLRERLPVLHETVVSNLTARLLTEIAGRIEPKSAPQRLVVSGVLAEESGKIADAFAARGFGLSDRREEGDWTAMLLERG